MANPVSNKKILEIQAGGAGAGPWRALAYSDVDGKSVSIVSAPDPGGQDMQPLYGRSLAKGGKLEIIGMARGGEPALATMDVQLPHYAYIAYRNHIQGKHNVRVREYTGDVGNKTNFVNLSQMIAAYNTSGGAFSKNLMDDSTNDSAMQLRTFSQSGLVFEELRQLDYSNLTAALAVGNYAANRVYSFGVPAEAGIDGETANNDGKQDFLILTDMDTPTTGSPQVVITRDGGATITKVDVAAVVNGNAVGATLAGGYLFLACTGTAGGVVRAPWDDVLAGSATFTYVSGIASGDVTNDVLAVSHEVIYSVENSGIIMRSTDGGFTFSVFDAGVLTTENLTRIEARGENLVWIAGENNKLIKITNGTSKELITTGGPTSNIKAVRIPPGFNRGTEVYLGYADGSVWVSKDEGDSFASYPFDGSGSGSIDDIVFAGVDGQYMYVLQQNASSQSRVLLDLSGGYLRQDVKELRAYATPVINSLSAALLGRVVPYDTIMACGEVSSSNAYVAKIEQNSVA